jgi:hypothetical protein
LASTTRRLPGIRFETTPPPTPEVLPRMDIAAFVGFAASGPIDVPVPVEDAAQFADVFGADAPLAWNAARGEQLNAYLGPAVRAFFRNGGRRCWVVRVADTRRARSDLFPISGLAGVDVEGTLAPAELRARSVGSWADTTSVTSRIESAPLLLEERGLLSYDTADPVAVGDLIRVTYPNRPWTLLFTVGSVREGGLAGEHPYWTRTAVLTPGANGHVHFRGARGQHRIATATIASVDSDSTAHVLLERSDGRPFPVTSAPPAGSFVRIVFGSRQLWLDVAEVESAEAGGAALVGTPIQVQTRKPAMTLVQPPGALAERLTLTLRCDDEVRGPCELGGLGFAPAHSHYLGNLPTDDAVYGPDAGNTALQAAAAEPRFPLAGPATPPLRYVPLAASILASGALRAVPPPGSTRLRDGLQRFDTGVFVDAQLAGTRSSLLMDEADFIRYRSPTPRALRGIHSLLAIDEATIVAVPDAVQNGWHRAGAGRLHAADPPDAPPTLDWSSFLDCTSHIPAAPLLSLIASPGPGLITLTWTATDGSPATYELQEDVVPSFDGAETIWSGDDREYTVYARPGLTTLYFRVRAIVNGTAGGWSNGKVVRTTGDRDWVVDDTSDYTADGLTSLHGSLLRMSAARGDLFAVLALPEQYREDAAAAYPAALRASVRESDTVYSHGALYHPWLYSADPTNPTLIRRSPPDGAAAGEIAARSIARGAWVAPANTPLRDVVALDPPLADYQQLFDAQVNVIRQDPGGFLALAADTLSLDDSLRPIGVRRLLHTLRRLAILYGNRYAFEPNGDVLRRTVRRSFETLLTYMFARGAFTDFQVSAYAPNEETLVVELRVAPSRPLTFLTVRLTRTGAGTIQVETR